MYMNVIIWSKKTCALHRGLFYCQCPLSELSSTVQDTKDWLVTEVVRAVDLGDTLYSASTSVVYRLVQVSLWRAVQWFCEHIC